ncbi:MAG: prepilin-type N-terminal cleavage/methylation domain-containing protein [Candidatus Paceibacteria bacterium]|jgi:prepilin-type N-terminal cleavage/methylation domain-containing protein
MKIHASRRTLQCSGPSRAGFTLLELLAVMVILGILMTFLAFRLGGLGEAANYNVTEQFLNQISLAANSYEAETGNYPKSSWDSSWGATPNKTNLGGEILCVQLWGKEFGGTGISDDQLRNSDQDEAKKDITTHGNNSLFELIDAWENPIAYFHRQDYGREDSYMTLDDTGEWDVSVVKALKNPKTNNYYNPRGFQLISAGEDGIFGTLDDIHNFRIAE